jgi:hypothetical protein
MALFGRKEIFAPVKMLNGITSHNFIYANGNYQYCIQNELMVNVNCVCFVKENLDIQLTENGEILKFKMPFLDDDDYELEFNIYGEDISEYITKDEYYEEFETIERLNRDREIHKTIFLNIYHEEGMKTIFKVNRRIYEHIVYLIQETKRKEKIELK